MSAEGDLTITGDFTLVKTRGRWAGTCYHCGRTTAAKHFVGLAESAIREHVRDVHRRDRIRRDIRETWARS